MADPLTSNIGLAVPTRGSDSGTWDVPVNNDMTAIDGLFGGVLSLTVTAATTFTLGVPSGFTATPSGGPVQSQNAVIRLSGTLTGNSVITLPAPGFYIIDNRVTGSFTTNYVQFRAVGTGEIVSTQPFCPTKIFNDGTNVRFVDQPMPGTMNYFGASSLPAWVNACTIPPWLPCDGSVYTIGTTYIFLGALLGSAFGGNGVTTFGVPDLRGRVALPLDPGGTRITSAGSGINGNSLGAAGGSQNQTLVAGNIPLLTTGTESATHTHGYTAPASPSVTGGNVGGAAVGSGVAANTGTESATHTHTTGNVSPSGFTTVMPAQVVGIAVIKT